ncbi:MAG: enolase C-terminal domain-like protein [Candidatus Aenigmatarchaeota archaeon]
MIKDIAAVPAWNSRGEKTVKVVVKTDKGAFFAYAPSGKSKGRWEAPVLSVEQIMQETPEIRKNLTGLDEGDWEKFDSHIEQVCGRNFEKCGANFACALSMAVIRAASLNRVYKILGGGAAFPYPIGNVVGGGAHMGSTAIQEFLVIPVKAKTIAEAVETNIAVWQEVGRVLSRSRHIGRNDEGAWISGTDDVQTMDVVVEAAEHNGARVGIDVAASQLFIKGKYQWASLKKEFSTSEQLEFLKMMIEKYRLVYVEDPFNENDYAAFAELRKSVKCIICGDDLYASQALRIGQGAQHGATNAAIIKIDQAGTVSRALRAVDACDNGQMAYVVSHRSGETCDSFIADFAVGTGAKFIKCGIAGGERTAKLNRLLEIWNEVSETTAPQMYGRI